MIVKSILLFLLLIVQYQIINKLFSLSDRDNVEKWGSLLTNLVVLGFFTHKYLENFDLFSQIERLSLIGSVIVVVLVLWSYNYVPVFRNLFVNDKEPEVVVSEEEEPTITSTSTTGRTQPSYLNDYVGFGEGKHLKVEPPLDLRPYLNDDKEFSKYYHKNRFTDKFDYRFNNLFHEPKEENNNVNTKRYHSIKVKNYNNITDANNYKVRTNTRHIPEKMDHLITM